MRREGPAELRYLYYVNKNSTSHELITFSLYTTTTNYLAIGLFGTVSVSRFYAATSQYGINLIRFCS